MHKYTEEELIEETKAVKMLYEARLKDNDNPLSGEELFKAAIKSLDEIMKSDLL